MSNKSILQSVQLEFQKFFKDIINEEEFQLFFEASLNALEINIDLKPKIMELMNELDYSIYMTDKSVLKSKIKEIVNKLSLLLGNK